MSEWETEIDWREVTPFLPVVTVDGDLVWFKKCQMRVLKSWLGDRTRQYRSIPVSSIWQA